MTSYELREKAARYRQIAANMADRRTINALHELAGEYEVMAAELETGEKFSPKED